MASILSKLQRAAFATRASRSAVGRIAAGAARPADAIRVFSAAAAGGPKSSEEEEKTRPKCEVAWAAYPSQTRDVPLSNQGCPAGPIRVSPEGGPKSSQEEDQKTRPKCEVAWAAYPSQRDVPLSNQGGLAAAPIRVSPAGHPMSEEDEDDVSRPPLDVDENALKSDEAMWAFYEYWCKYHGISRTRREMKRRFKVFSDNARRVHSAGGANGPMSMNPFADWTKKEVSLLIGKPKPHPKKW